MYALFVPLIIISCNTLKVDNNSISNGSEFQYEKNGSSKDGYNYLGNEKDNFEINFLYSFNDSVYIKIDGDELFNSKIITDDITDNPNLGFKFSVDKYNGKIVNIIIPYKNVSESFYLNDKYRYVYIFYYDEKLIVRYSNKAYNIY
ncbi:hypothetical protein SAMN05421741_12414 [Paenimyroides ummariense]|uniref:Uncharacterized protein n=1 Tax=Paenimyroides ummariense TaxID=913024 RepID=A0A1I5F1Z9_9FLAO|nr:hypothetical protein [Paenimyroides ummariense]SFO17670.1 hypothetical protein SAMN05421741_12414 [Paenimyroides ummariense]